MSARKPLYLFVLLLCVIGWVACGDSSRPTPVINSFSISASSMSPAAGLTSQLTVTATYNNGTSVTLNGVT